MSDLSKSAIANSIKRPFGVQIITILDGLLLGAFPFPFPAILFILGMMAPLPGKNPVSDWFFYITQWYFSAEQSLYRFYLPLKIGNILVMILAIHAWRGREIGRILLLALITVLSLIQPIAFMLLRYDNHTYGGHYDDNFLLSAAHFLLAFTLIGINFWCFTRRETNVFYNQHSKINESENHPTFISSDLKDKSGLYFGISPIQWILVLIALAVPVVINVAAMKMDIGTETLYQLLNGTYTQPFGILFDDVRTSNPLFSIVIGFSITLIPLGVVSWLTIFISNRDFFQSLSSTSKFVAICIFALITGTIFSFAASTFMPITWSGVFHGAYHQTPHSYVVDRWSGKYLFPIISGILFFAMSISRISHQKT